MKRLPAKDCPYKAVNTVNNVSFTIGAEAGDVINVALQLKDADGNDIAQRAAVKCYIAGDANGDTLATAPSTVAIGTDGLLMEEISNSVFTAVSESDGDIDINIGKSGAATYYLVVILPDGSLVVSDAITFAA